MDSFFPDPYSSVRTDGWPRPRHARRITQPDRSCAERSGWASTGSCDSSSCAVVRSPVSGSARCLRPPRPGRRSAVCHVRWTRARVTLSKRQRNTMLVNGDASTLFSPRKSEKGCLRAHHARGGIRDDPGLLEKLSYGDKRNLRSVGRLAGQDLRCRFIRFPADTTAHQQPDTGTYSHLRGKKSTRRNRRRRRRARSLSSALPFVVFLSPIVR